MGNTRISYKATGQSLEKTAETAFDPWGVVLRGAGTTNVNQNRFEYQRKESEKTFGLNRINLGARTVNPTTGRFDRVDRFANKYLNNSPYVYVLNRPTIAIDPDGNRVYFSSGAGHDSDNSGYIPKMLNAFSRYANINNSIDIDAHARPFFGIPIDALWAIGEYSQKPYFNLKNATSVGMGLTINENVTESNINWRISSTVEQIQSNIKNNPINENEQFNLVGYSTGAVIMAQSSLMLAKKGHVIDNLILIGATFDNKSELYKSLSSNKRIKNIIRVDIPGDNVIEGVGALKSFLEKGNNHPHFRYAFGEDADENRKALALLLQQFGISDYKQDKK